MSRAGLTVRVALQLSPAPALLTCPIHGDHGSVGRGRNRRREGYDPRVLVSEELSLEPSANAIRRARRGGLLVGGTILALALLGWILILVGLTHPHSQAPTDWTPAVLVFGGAALAGPVLGWIGYALLLPAAITFADRSLLLKSAVRTRRLPTSAIRLVYRGSAGAAGPAYFVFSGQKWGWNGVSLVVSTYGQSNIERLLAMVGAPIKGDFTKVVTWWTDRSSL